MFNAEKKLNDLNSNLYEKFETRLKLTIYSFMNEILQFKTTSIVIFSILLLIEAAQFLWYTVHPDLSFLWQTDLADYLRVILKYVQADEFIRNSGSLFFSVTFYLAFGIQIIMTTCIIFALYMLTKPDKKRSQILYYLLRLISLYFLLLKTIATLPLFQIFTYSLICNNDQPYRSATHCYAGTQFIYFFLGLFGIISLVACSILTQIFYIDLNPYSTCAFAASRVGIDVLKFLLKIAIAIYTAVDPQFTQGKVFILVYGIIWAFMLLIRYNLQGYFKLLVTIVVISMESLALWMSLVANFHAFVIEGTEDDTGIYFLIIGAPFAVYTYYSIYSTRRWTIMQMDATTFVKAKYLETYIYIVLDLFAHKEHVSDRMELEGLIRYHATTCILVDQGCPCVSIGTCGERIEEIYTEKTVYKDFIKSFIEASLMLFPKSPRLHLLYAYFQHEMMSKRFKSLYELMKSEQCRPSLQEEFSMYLFKQIIEKEMRDAEIRGSGDMKGIDINQVIEFQEKFVQLQENIAEMVKMRIIFWKELQQQNSKVPKLMVFGAKITKQAEVTEKLYNRLYEVNPNHLKMLDLYGNYVHEVLTDTINGRKILEKIAYLKKSIQVNKNISDGEYARIQENNNTCVVTCSGNPNTLGKVLSASAELKEVLQYTNTELIGHNINKIMPTIISNLHDDFIKHYFENLTNEPHERKNDEVFPLNKLGYITPCLNTLKIIPSLNEGLKIVGFLRSKDVNASMAYDEHIDLSKLVHYVLFGGPENKIYGVSESCYWAFGISATLTRDHSLSSMDVTIDQILPEFALQNREEMKNAGIIMRLDTTTVNDALRLKNQGSRIDYDDEYIESFNAKILISSREENQSRYRSAKVRVILIQESVYGLNQMVQVLKITEIIEDYGTLKSDISEAGITKNSSKNPHHTKVDRDFDVNIVTAESASNLSTSSIAEEVHIIRDMKVQLYEKKTPSVITTLRILPLFFISFLIAVIIVQYVRKTEIADEYQYGLDATHYGYWRHDLLAEINLNFRFLHLMAQNMITYDGTTQAAYETNLRNKIADLTSTIDFVQFMVIEGRIQMNKTSGVLIIGNYEFLDLLEDGYIYKRTDVYNKFMWRSISKMYQLNNSTLDSLFLPLTSKDSMYATFYYVKTNGLGNLRKGSEDIADSFVTFYLARPEIFKKFFIITTLIAIGFIVAFQLFVTWRILAILNARINSLALFGYIPLPEIATHIEQCQFYTEQYLYDLLSEIDSSISHHNDESFPILSKSNDNSIEITKYSDLSMSSPSMNDRLASLPQTDHQAPHFLGQLLSQTSQEGGLLSPKSDAPLMSPGPLLSPMSQTSFKPHQIQRKSSDYLETPNAFVSPKFLSSPRGSFRGNQKRASILGSTSLIGLLKEKREGDFDKRQKSLKTVKILETDVNETKQSLPIMTRTYTNAEDRGLITRESTTDKLGHSKSSKKDKKKKNNKNKNKGKGKKVEEEEEEEDEEEIYYEYFREKRKILGDPRKHNRGQTIVKILAATSLFIAAFVAKYFLELYSIHIFESSVKHLQRLGQRSPDLRYTNTFCLEELAAAGASAVYPNYPAATAERKNLRTNYTNAVFENQRLLMGTLKGKFPSYFDDYIARVTSYMNEDTCAILYSNSSTKQSECEMIGDTEFKANLIQREIRIVEDISDLMISFYGESTLDTQTQIDYINGEKFKAINEILQTATPAIRDLIDRFLVVFENYMDELKNLDMIVFGGFLILFFVMFTVVWTWYLRHLTRQIEVIKGMLNMMSLHVLMNNKSLREAFTYSSVINIIK